MNQPYQVEDIARVRSSLNRFGSHAAGHRWAKFMATYCELKQHVMMPLKLPLPLLTVKRPRRAHLRLHTLAKTCRHSLAGRSAKEKFIRLGDVFNVVTMKFFVRDVAGKSPVSHGVRGKRPRVVGESWRQVSRMDRACLEDTFR